MEEGWLRSHVLKVSACLRLGIAALTEQYLVSALDAGVKLRPTEEELKAIGPAFKQKWEEYYVGVPDKPVMWIGPVSMWGGPSGFSRSAAYFPP